MKRKVRQMILALAAVLFAGVILAVLPVPAFAADDIARGSYGNTSWVIDSKGALTVTGTGEIGRTETYNDEEETTIKVPDWYKYKSDITSARISVTGMKDASALFYGCYNLASVNLKNFDTGSVTNMSHMFYDCESLASLDVSKFNTGSVTDMSDMFYDCSSLKTLDVSKFDTGSVTSMSHMFYDCSSLKTLDVSGFATSRVTDMGGMFSNCKALKTLDVSKFDTGSARDMSDMFYNCKTLKTLDVSGFDTGSATNMEEMFGYCSSLKTLNVKNFITGNVTQMDGMFLGCSSLGTLDVSRFDTGKVEDMNYMFSGCSSLKTLDVSGFDTGSATHMGGMFSNCASVEALDVSRFDTGNVVDMYYMFAGCSSLKKLDVRSFTTGSVTDMSYMFNGCSSLKTLDLSNFDASRAEDMWYMFYGCTSLTTINAPRNIACENAYVVTSEDSYVWCEPDGTIVTKLPQNASESVKLTRKTRLTKENTTIVLSKTAFTYSGKAKKPTVTVYNAKGKEISSDYYDVTYKDNKEVGKATLTVTFTDKYIGTIHKTYKINPKGTELKKVTSEKTKKITVTWKKATQITGYEIQYATDKKFTKKTTQTRTVTVKSKTRTATIGKLSAKKTYYVRIRTYTTIDGKNYCSAWSKALSVTTK